MKNILNEKEYRKYLESVDAFNMDKESPRFKKFDGEEKIKGLHLTYNKI